MRVARPTWACETIVEGDVAQSRSEDRQPEVRGGGPFAALLRWPPAVYLLVSIGSIFASMGGQRHWLLALGLVLQATGLTVALFLATERRSGRPRPRGLMLVLAAVAAFYGITAVAAADVGLRYVIAALLAFLIPGTATALAVSTARTMTRETDDGRQVDLSAEDRGPVPRLGLDNSRPLGDSPDLHGDVSPHDLPVDHPGRHAVEERAKEAGGRTTGLPPDE
jgi:pimeloyl-ACP methyl ester carboxylesterase